MEPVILDLKVSPQEFAVIWASLGKQPAEYTFPVMTSLKAQVEAQEQANAADRPVL